MRRELHHTLLAAIDALSPPPSGLVVTCASLDLPLELVAARDPQGQPVAVGSVPHSRWDAGFLPPVHFAHLEIELLDDPSPTVWRRGGS